MNFNIAFHLELCIESTLFEFFGENLFFYRACHFKVSIFESAAGDPSRCSCSSRFHCEASHCPQETQTRSAWVDEKSYFNTLQYDIGLTEDIKYEVNFQNDNYKIWALEINYWAKRKKKYFERRFQLLKDLMISRS